MNEKPGCGESRPGGRTARTRDVVLAAVRDELESGGLNALTLGVIAARSGVHVTTIRRRWRSVEGVITDLLSQEHLAIPVPDSGDFCQDVYELAMLIADFCSSPSNQALLDGMVVATAHDPCVADRVRGIFSACSPERTQLVENAMARGDVPAGTCVAAVLDALGAPFFYRLLILRRPIDVCLVRMSAAIVTQAAISGCFVLTESDC